MKKIFVLLMLAMCMDNAGFTQWYSYDGFRKKAITVTQTFAISNALFRQQNIPVISQNLSRLTTNHVKNFIDTNSKAYSASLNTMHTKRVRAIDSLNNAIVSLQRNVVIVSDTTNANDAAQLARLIQMRDSIATAPEPSTIKYQKMAELRYLRKRLPGLRFWPVTSRLAAESFFENTDTIVQESDEDGIFSFEFAYLNYLTNSKRLGVFLEPLSDYIGPVRLSLGLLLLAPATKDTIGTTGAAPAVAKAKKDSVNNQQAFVDRFKSSGGYASLNASFALLQAHDPLNYFDIKSYLSPRFCLDVPRNDTAVQKFALHTQLGVETQVKIRTFRDVFNILLCHRYTRIAGNPTFYDQMGFKNNDRKAFDFTTWTAGFIAKGKLAVYYTWYAGKSLVTETMKNNNSLTANIQL